MDLKKKFTTGEVLAREGEQGYEAFKIISGFVKITQTKNGEDVYIRQCGPGQIIGEMALLEDRPRTATITAITDTEIQIISDKLLSDELGKLSPLVTDLIVELCDRIKEKDKDWLGVVDKTRKFSGKVCLELIAQTDEAKNALGDQSIMITDFPCRIGRPSDSFFEKHIHRNDIELNDQKPYQVSRSHITLDFGSDIFVVIDRNSKFGARINGKKIGGDEPVGWSSLTRGDNELVLGNDESQQKYIIRL